MNNCLCYRNVFHNGIYSFSKKKQKQKQKTAQNFEYFIPYDFVQISPACGPNTYLIMYGETSNVSISNGNIKCLILKSISAVNVPLKLFCVTLANADTGILKSLRTLFDTYLDHILAKFELNCIVQNVQIFELFDKFI